MFPFSASIEVIWNLVLSIFFQIHFWRKSEIIMKTNHIIFIIIWPFEENRKYLRHSYHQPVNNNTRSLLKESKIWKIASSITHGWSHSDTFNSSSVGQLKQLHLFQSWPFTDPAFRSCHSNITLLKFHDWLVGHKNKNDKNPCFFHYFTVQIKYESRVR